MAVPTSAVKSINSTFDLTLAADDGMIEVQWINGRSSWYHTGWLHANKYDDAKSLIRKAPAVPPSSFPGPPPVIPPSIDFNDVMHAQSALLEHLELIVRLCRRGACNGWSSRGFLVD